MDDNEKTGVDAETPETTETAENTQETPDKDGYSVEELRARLDKLTGENQALKADAEKWREAENAKKTDLEKALEAQKAAEKRAAHAEQQANKARVASEYGITPENLRLLGDGSVEELTENAKRVKFLQDTITPPPSNRPVESLKAGSGVDRVDDDVTIPTCWRI